MIFVYIVVCVFGLVIGSFINVLICRIPEGKSIVAPPSACMKCGTRLKPPDLVPVFSYIFLRGRCRYCGAAISPRYPAVELLTAAVFVVLFAKFGLTVAFFSYAFLMTILTAVLFIDYDRRIIPDELVIAGLLGGAAVFACNIFMPGKLAYGDENWWTPLLGLIAGSGILLLVAIAGSLIYKTEDAMGIGDVKLLAPIGVFLGWKLGLAALFLSVLLAGVVSLLLVILGLKGRKDTIPFGPFIVLGTFIAIMWGWDIIFWYIGL
jgi:leader peptidase (prepilin peptidase)/N-methyltransferase